MDTIFSGCMGPRVERKTSKEIAPNFFMADSGNVGPDHLVNSKGILLLGVGNPLLDISSHVPTAMLEKYGLKSGDIILAEEQHAGIYDDLVKDHAPEYIAGGATQNSIRVCAWMLKAAGRDGGACAFAGCVGDDANGKKLAECATAGGVQVEYQVDAETPTGVCGVLVDPTNERTLVTRLDAANNFTLAHLETPQARGRAGGWQRKQMCHHRRSRRTGGTGSLPVLQPEMVGLRLHHLPGRRDGSATLHCPMPAQKQCKARPTTQNSRRTSAGMDPTACTARPAISRMANVS